ncbi:hypothetical protein CRM22_002555 [Opisthorchis felineus]|uniref:Uncharacterized protein n=1 Tax=Opisthorchis felineus TaxID=147828 RepID=A0A4S2M5I0_OPIFE|nr:hypothetical protein CRM22_002555 [Opisthorchis felineus]
MLPEIVLFCSLFYLPASPQAVVSDFSSFRCPNPAELQNYSRLLATELPRFLVLSTAELAGLQILDVSTQEAGSNAFRIRIRLPNNRCYLVTVVTTGGRLVITAVTPIVCPLRAAC